MANSLIIIEPQALGHRMHYVRHIAREAIQRGLTVSVATWEESLEHPSFALMKSELKGAFNTLLLPKVHVSKELLTRKMDMRLQYAYFLTMRTFHRELPASQRPDFYIVSCLYMIDKIVPFLGSPFGEIAWSGIVMRETFHHQSMQILGKRRRSDIVKKFLFLWLMRNRTLRKIFTIDAALPLFIAKYYPKLAQRIEYIPDPVEMRGRQSREEARQRLGIDDAAVVLLVYGVIDGRKRIEILLESLNAMDSSSRVVLLVAGPQSNDVRQLMKEEAAQNLLVTNRLILHDAYLVESDEFQAFRASDLVWVGYREHFTMSAVLIQAAAMGLPVVGCREGLIGWLIGRHGLGVATNTDDVTRVTASLSELATNATARAEFGKNGLAQAMRHTPQEFANTILEIV